MYAFCNFNAITINHVGSTNDANAFDESILKELCSALPYPFHWNGDAAYTVTEQMMFPFAGLHLHLTDPPKEWFNFWHSQLRIIIERTFGIFIEDKCSCRRRWKINR